MLRQSHWKTKIEGLTKRQFVLVSVHSVLEFAHVENERRVLMFLKAFLCL